jgi:AcrR family transcriptional regulator
MQKQGSSETRAGVLDPTLPADIGVRSQRRRIVEAMIESCAERTYAATTIADIVAGAGISRTTFYKRFPDKRACFDATLDFCVEELREAAAGSHAASDSPVEIVRKAAAAILELMAAEPARAQLILGEAVAVEPAVVERFRAALIAAIERLFEPAGKPARAHSDTRLAFGRAQVLIFDLISAGRSDRLPGLLPEIVYLALLPFVGHEEARRQAG